MKKTWMLIAGVILIALGVAALILAFTGGEKDFSMTRSEYPKIDGATAMRPMSVEIAKAVIGLTQEEAEDFITHNTTAKAYDNLISGKCDLIFVSEPSDAIIKKAADQGVTFEMAGIGRDGFVFIVNRQNPVESLTLDEIRDIYSGKITDWSALGGEKTAIKPYVREAGSGSQNLMEKMVMGDTPFSEDLPRDLLIESMEGLVDAVASYQDGPAAIGYSIYLYAKEQYVRDSVRFLKINGVMPSDETIADGSYPLSKVVYAVFRADEKEGSPVRRLVEWLRTPEGQAAVTEGGYVPLK